MNRYNRIAIAVFVALVVLAALLGDGGSGE